MANADQRRLRTQRLLGWGALSALAVFAAALCLANILDYRRYRRAVNFEKVEGIDYVRELAHLCLELGKNGPVRMDDYPDTIARLSPTWVSVDRGYAQIGLYNRSENASVFLVVERYEDDDVVTLCDYTRGKFDMRPIYVSNQERYDFLHPKNRIVTLAQSTVHEFVQWIVLSNEVRVISTPGSGGPHVLGSRTISREERHAVEAAVLALPGEFRGRHFSAGVIDGISLTICLQSDGRAGPADIELDNTWRDEAGPLIDLVARLSPPQHELNFREAIERDMAEYPRTQQEANWAAEAKRNEPPPPWWCLWPRFNDS